MPALSEPPHSSSRHRARFPASVQAGAAAGHRRQADRLPAPGHAEPWIATAWGHPHKTLKTQIYKAPVYDRTLLTTNAVAGAIALIASGWLLARQIQLSGELRRRAIALGAATNLLTCLIAFLLSEAVVRGVARRSPEGIEVGDVRLTPSWSEVAAHSRQVMACAAPWGTWDPSYFVYDSGLG